LPKPNLKREKARKKSERAKLAMRFRDAVWSRDVGTCRQCGIRCWAISEAGFLSDTGHVHHLRGRNVAPEDRYNPDAAVLLCAECHRAVHDGKLKLTCV